MAGVTLLELMTVMVVITILVVMLIPAFENVRSRVERVTCSGNLKTLYLGASSYLQERNSWPQISTKLAHNRPKEFARVWMDALRPYGIGEASWICPTIQRDAGAPDYMKPDLVRIDYLATPFDSKRITPYRWSTQPWFAERGSVHGNGNLMIFSDGAIRSLNEVTGKK